MTMTYKEFSLQYPHLDTADWKEYIIFLADRPSTEEWHKTVNPQRMKEFFEKALPNWKTKNKRVPNPISKYRINYAEEWLQENHHLYAGV